MKRLAKKVKKRELSQSSIHMPSSQQSLSKGEFSRPPRVDIYLVVTTLLLLSVSVVMIYSTTALSAKELYNDPLRLVKTQGLAICIGVFVMAVARLCSIQLLQRFSPLFLFLSLVALLIPMIPGVGAAAGGAQRWIRIAGFQLQPAEFVKVFMIIFLAGYLSRHESRLSDFSSGVLKPVIIFGTVACLLLAQPDFGSATIMFIVAIVMLFVGGVSIRYLFLSGMLLASCAAALIYTSPYRMARVASFLSPWDDAQGSGYQLLQSLIAVSTGSFTGVGLGASQQKLHFLPAAHTDFIFAVIGEEAGLFGCLFVVALFLIILWRGVKISQQFADDTFPFTLGVGLTMLIVLPAMINIGVVLGLLPTKGLVLPLVGYGGSSIVGSLLIIGLLLSLTRTLYTRYSAN